VEARTVVVQAVGSSSEGKAGCFGNGLLHTRKSFWLYEYGLLNLVFGLSYRGYGLVAWVGDWVGWYYLAIRSSVRYGVRAEATTEKVMTSVFSSLCAIGSENRV
jgi:hypothetical protein